MSRTLRLTRLAGALAASLLLGACAGLAPPSAVAPAIEPAPLPARFAAAGATVDNPALAPADWNLLGDATLAALIRQGLHGNLSLQQAIARIEHGRALAAGRDAARGPTGGAQIGASAAQLAAADRPAGSGRSERVFANLALGWELDLFGRLASAAQASHMQVQAATDDAHAVRMSVAADIAQAWFELQGLREQERLTRDVVANRQQVLRLVALRTRSGESARFDEARAQAELADAQAQLPPLQASARLAGHRLAVLLGSVPSEFTAPTASDAALPRKVTMRIPAPTQWLAQRADLRAARARLQGQALDIRAIEAEFMPRLEISGVLGFVAGTLGGLGSAGSAAWWLTPTVSAPVFDRGRIEARLAAARAQERESLLAYREAMLVAVADVEGVLDQLRYGQQQLDHLRERAEHARQADALAQARYRAGDSGLLELLDAQRGAHLAALALSGAHIRQQQQTVVLLKALGTVPPQVP